MYLSPMRRAVDKSVMVGKESVHTSMIHSIDLRWQVPYVQNCYVYLLAENLPFSSWPNVSSTRCIHPHGCGAITARDVRLMHN